MSDEEPVVKVTLGTIYNKLTEVDKKLDPIPAQVLDHESRIRRLERQTWRWVGGMAAVASIAALLAAYFSNNPIH